MKRFSFLAVAATAIITLSACGTENSENAENNEKAEETASVEANGEEKEENDSAENEEQADKDTASESDEAAEADASAEDSVSTEEAATENEEESAESADTAGKDASSEDDAPEETASEDTANSEEAASEESTEASKAADTEANSTSASEEEEAVTEEVTVYYLDGDLMNTISETRSLEAASENDLPFEAVQEWLDGPETEDAVSPLPVETEVQFVKFKDNTAYVSFEPSVLEATTVGSTLELAFVEQLATLMDQFGYGQTQILVDGEVVTDFYGHREIDQPIEAKDPSELYGSN